MYNLGAIRNVEDIRYLYPGWRVLIFFDNSVAPNVTEALRAAGAELRNISRYTFFFFFSKKKNIFFV